MEGHTVEVDVPDSALTIRGDSELLSMALGQFLDNAAKYSFAGEKVKVSAWESHSEIMISVHNVGPAIPISDRERTFRGSIEVRVRKAWLRGPVLVSLP
jgi:two-component system sensor histidine kinase KdpD